MVRPGAGDLVAVRRRASGRRPSAFVPLCARGPAGPCVAGRPRARSTTTTVLGGSTSPSPHRTIARLAPAELARPRPRRAATSSAADAPLSASSAPPGRSSGRPSRRAGRAGRPPGRSPRRPPPIARARPAPRPARARPSPAGPSPPRPRAASRRARERFDEDHREVRAGERQRYPGQPGAGPDVHHPCAVREQLRDDRAVEEVPLPDPGRLARADAGPRSTTPALASRLGVRGRGERQPVAEDRPPADAAATAREAVAPATGAGAAVSLAVRRRCTAQALRETTTRRRGSSPSLSLSTPLIAGDRVVHDLALERRHRPQAHRLAAVEHLASRCACRARSARRAGTGASRRCRASAGCGCRRLLHGQPGQLLQRLQHRAAVADQLVEVVAAVDARRRRGRPRRPGRCRRRSRATSSRRSR